MVYNATPFIGSGELYIDGRDVGNATEFSISPPKIETKDMKSLRRDSYGLVVKSIPISFEQSLKFTLTDINKDNLILAMYGEGSVINQAAGSVTDVTITVTKDRWTMLNHKNIKKTPAVVVKSTNGTTTYEEGENKDYIIDYESGRIYITPNSNISNGDVKISYSYDAYKGYKINANKQQVIEAEIRLIGKDIANNRKIDLIVYKASIKPQGEIDFLSTDFIKINFQGDILSTSNGTWAITVLE